MKLLGNLGLKATSIKYISTGVAALGFARLFGTGECGGHLCPNGPGLVPSCCAAFDALGPVSIGSAHIGRAIFVGGSLQHPRPGQVLLPAGSQPPMNSMVAEFEHDPVSQRRFGGGTIGYNMQRGGVVFGIEADFGAMGLDGEKYLNAPVLNPQSLKRQLLTSPLAFTVT